MSDDPVLYERRGAAAWLTLNRPEALNALTIPLIQCLDACLTRAEAEAELRAKTLFSTIAAAPGC